MDDPVQRAAGDSVRASQLLSRFEQERIALARRHLLERGVPTFEELQKLHAEQRVNLRIAQSFEMTALMELLSE